MAETFGKTTKGGVESTVSANYIVICKYTSGSAGSLEKISVYIKQKDTAQPNVKCALYDASLNLVTNGETEQLQVGGGQDGWMHFGFLSAPTVIASTIYILAVWPSNTYYLYSDDGEANQGGYKSNTYDSWPNPLTGATWLSRAYSMYATYEEAPPAAKTLVQAALISIPPLIVLPTLGQILRFAGGC